MTFLSPAQLAAIKSARANRTDFTLTLRKSDGTPDWYVIEWANHDGQHWLEPTEYGAALMHSARLGDADVEGYGYEMLGIATAIANREPFECRRCAVRFDPDGARFWSPRNSGDEGPAIPLDVADALAATILAAVLPTEGHK